MTHLLAPWFQLRKKHQSLYLLLLGVSLWWIVGDIVLGQIIPNADKVLHDPVPNKGLERNENVGETNFATIVGGINRYISGVLAIVATILITWEGALLMASSEDADALAKRQKYIIWIIFAFTVILLAQSIVKKMFFGDIITGFVSADPTSFGETIVAEMNGILSYITPMILALAVTLLVIGGFRLIVGSASEEALANARKHILYSILGILILVSIRVVMNIFLGDEGTVQVPDSEKILTFLSNLLTYISGFLGLIAFVAIVWAGLRMIFSFGDSESGTEARKIIVYAIAGLILAVFAYTIAFFLLPG